MIEHFIVLVFFNKFANFDVFYDIMIISSRAALKKMHTFYVVLCIC